MSRPSVTGRAPAADDRVRTGLGPTRGLVLALALALVDGTAGPVDVAGPGPGTGDAFAERTGPGAR
ncbi:hypothetical protein [Streptomyces sp. XY152]|uniref:hypothetical protein n=1 Tax=Streptomyces sp. XY152 TaxID=1415560 RepID=UPI0006AF7890|nr:hypothetical protein [Streptomyces sp. XY152]